jgi:hypothetical protein
MRLKALIGAAIAAGAFTVPYSANAAISAGTDAPPLAELFLTVWDTNTGTTFAQDLGINASTANLNTPLSPVSVDPLFGTTFGASWASNTALRYGVYTSMNNGVDQEFIAFTAPTGTNTSTWLTANPADVDQNSQNIQGLANGQNNGSANYAANIATSATSGAGSVGNNPGNLFNGLLTDITGRVTYGAIGDALTLFKIGFDSNSTGDLNVRNTFLNFTFDGTTLSYAAGGAPVPLPAGLWLLGSALLGLVGVSRRQSPRTV